MAGVLGGEKCCYLISCSFFRGNPFNCVDPFLVHFFHLHKPLCFLVHADTFGGEIKDSSIYLVLWCILVWRGNRDLIRYSVCADRALCSDQHELQCVFNKADHRQTTPVSSVQSRLDRSATAFYWFEVFYRIGEIEREQEGEKWRRTQWKSGTHTHAQKPIGTQTL